MGVQLFREGFVIPAENLEEAEPFLEKHYPKETKKLAGDIQQAWAAAPRGKNLRSAAYPETPEGVQLARLATVRKYVEDRKAQYHKELAQLKD